MSSSLQIKEYQITYLSIIIIYYYLSIFVCVFSCGLLGCIVRSTEVEFETIQQLCLNNEG